MGLDYQYVKDGNNAEALIGVFSSVKDSRHPVVVHINTVKGKGYAPAEQDKESYHYCTPFNAEVGKQEMIPDVEEYMAMLEWRIRQNEHPVAIRVPANGVFMSGDVVEEDYNLLNRYKVVNQGSKVAILALGSFFQLGQSVVELLKEEAGIDATLINPRYITGVDEVLLDELKADHQLVITLEDGVLDGGFGEKITRYYGATDMKVLNFGAKKEFVDRYDRQDFLSANHLTKESSMNNSFIST